MPKKIKQKTNFLNNFDSKQIVFCFPGKSNKVNPNENILIIDLPTKYIKKIFDQYDNPQIFLINKEFHDYYLAKVFNDTLFFNDYHGNECNKINLGDGSRLGDSFDSNKIKGALTMRASIFKGNNLPVENLGIPISVIKNPHFMDLYLIDLEFHKIIYKIKTKEKINIALNIKKLNEEIKRTVVANIDDYLYGKTYVDYKFINNIVKEIKLEKIDITLKKKIISDLVNHLSNLIIKSFDFSNNFNRELYKSLNQEEIQLSDLKGLFVRDHFNDLKAYCDLNLFNREKTRKIFNGWGIVENKSLDYIVNYINFGDMGPCVDGLSNKNFEVLIRGYLSALCRGIITRDGRYSKNLQIFDNLQELNDILDRFNKEELREYRNLLLYVINQIFGFNLDKRDVHSLSLTYLKKENDRYLQYLKKMFCKKIISIST